MSAITVDEMLAAMEWLQATRTDIIDIMKGDTGNGGVYVTTQTDIDKAERIIERILTDVKEHSVFNEPKA